MKTMITMEIEIPTGLALEFEDWHEHNRDNGSGSAAQYPTLRAWLIVIAQSAIDEAVFDQREEYEGR